MLYNVAQIAETTGQSKQNIYKKLKKKELIPHIIKKQGISYIDDIGLKIINDSYETNTENNPLNEEIAEDKTYSMINEEMFNLLKKELNDKNLQIQEKDRQLENYSDRLKQEQDLHKNTQILFKEKLPENLLLQEEHFEEIDTKLVDLKEKLVERHEQRHRSVWSKMFHKEE
jgi:hypothetical protein